MAGACSVGTHPTTAGNWSELLREGEPLHARETPSHQQSHCDSPPATSHSNSPGTDIWACTVPWKSNPLIFGQHVGVASSCKFPGNTAFHFRPLEPPRPS